MYASVCRQDMELSLAWQIMREGSWGKKKKRGLGFYVNTRSHNQSELSSTDWGGTRGGAKRAAHVLCVQKKKTHKRGSENGAASFAFLCYSIEDKMFLKNSRG